MFLRGRENPLNFLKFLLFRLILCDFGAPLENLVKYSVLELPEASRNRPDRSEDVSGALLYVRRVF